MKYSLHISTSFLRCAFLGLVLQTAAAQSSSPPPPQSPAATPQSEDSPHGTVLFQSHGEPPSVPPDLPAPDDWQTTDKANGPALTDVERGAITFTAYDMDVRLKPATSGLSARARLTFRNDGSVPLTRIAVQVSSSLRWEAATLSTSTGSVKLELAQHLIDTDADHTGKANEAVLTLPTSIKPGDAITIDTFYSGTMPVNTGRLERIGATHQQALVSDWDGVSADRIALRGFGNALWYPVAAPQLFLGEGAQLFDAIGQTEARETNATVRLRVGVEYTGDAPTAVYFCGRREPLTAQSDNPESPISAGSGIATAEFPTDLLGFRLPNLFVVPSKETLIAPAPAVLGASPASPPSSSSSSSSSSAIAPSEKSEAAATAESGPPMLAVETNDAGTLPLLASSAESVAPLLQSWLGAQPLSALTIIDNPGQPFEDGPMLVVPAASLGASTELPAMAHSLTHAWVQTGQPWMDEGLAQFFSLLLVEREQGRDAALLQMNNLLQPLALVEPDIEQGKAAADGQPLISARSEIYFRRKAAAVWFMLRTIAGEDALRSTLRAWRTQPLSHASPEDQARAFETLLEKRSGKDLRWFFEDWVLRDRGLPDLSIVDVTTRQLQGGSGHNSGWLTAVTVRNEGAAVADVPVTVRSGTFSTTSVVRVAGFGSATARVLVEAPPTEVVVNDGSTPEVQNVRHVREIATSIPVQSTPSH